jgi:hypothetical protein
MLRCAPLLHGLRLHGMLRAAVLRLPGLLGLTVAGLGLPWRDLTVLGLAVLGGLAVLRLARHRLTGLGLPVLRLARLRLRGPPLVAARRRGVPPAGLAGPEGLQFRELTLVLRHRVIPRPVATATGVAAMTSAAPARTVGIRPVLSHVRPPGRVACGES